MASVRDQIAALTQSLYQQHVAAKAPMEVESLRVHVLGGSVEDIVVPRLRLAPLAPGVHPASPMMAPIFRPGAVEMQEEVISREAAHRAIDRAFDNKSTYEDVDDVPSIDEPAEKKTYKRKLEP